MKTSAGKTPGNISASSYAVLVDGIGGLLEAARHSAARTVNALITATYWEIGRRVVEYEQHGRERADYGATLLTKLATDLTRRFGRGFSPDNLESMRLFYLAFPPSKISETASRIFDLSWITEVLPLSWSHYVHLIRRSRSTEALDFYHKEAVRGGWSVRQLDRQIATLYLNYAREHWSRPEENPPVGLILCAQKDDALAKYALEGLPNKVLAREYKLALPNEKLLARELEKTRKVLEARGRVV